MKYIPLIIIITLCTHSYAQTKTDSKLREELKKELKQEVKEELKKELKQEVKEELKKEMTQDSQKEKAEEITGLPSKNESWYYYIGFGIGSASYSGQLESSIDSAKRLGAGSTIYINVEPLAFYLPLLKHKALLGLTYSGGGDYYSNHTSPTTEIDIFSAPLAISTMYFFGENIGHHLFFRTDLGFSQTELTVRNPVTNIEIVREETGKSLQLGIGYGSPYKSKETRLLLSLNYRHESSDLGSINNIFVSMGWLL